MLRTATTLSLQARGASKFSQTAPVLGHSLLSTLRQVPCSTTDKKEHDDPSNKMRSMMGSTQLQQLSQPQQRSFTSTSRKSRRFFRPASVVAARTKSKAVKPDLSLAAAMPLSFEQMDNSTLVTLANMGNETAITEMLIRHIMTVDRVAHTEATETFQKISKVNRDGMYLLTLPYQVGIATALIAGFGSFPLVFDLGTAEWFNTHYVTTDVPESEDLETMLEVGAWTWNWMEPPLGQISFFLLCLQFSRAQMDNLGVKPYTTRVKHMRAQHLADLYPQYDRNLLMNFSMSKHIVHNE